MRQGPSEKCIWKIFYRAVFEYGLREVPGGQDHLAHGKTLSTKTFIKQSWFVWSHWIPKRR